MSQYLPWCVGVTESHQKINVSSPCGRMQKGVFRIKVCSNLLISIQPTMLQHSYSFRVTLHWVRKTGVDLKTIQKHGAYASSIHHSYASVDNIFISTEYSSKQTSCAYKQPSLHEIKFTHVFSHLRNIVREKVMRG